MSAGQGFAQGVQMMGSYLMPALQQRMQNQRYDKRMEQMDKRFYDRLALDQAWKDGLYGGSSMLSEPAAPAMPQQPAPYQVTREATPVEALRSQFKDPSYTPPGPPMNYKAQFSDPTAPAPAAPTSPGGSSYVSGGRSTPAPAAFRGPSPSSTPFSSSSSRPFTEQRTFNEPKDTSMVINKMPEVTHQAPQIRRVGPNTPIPPASLLRPSMRGMRGY